MKGRSGAVVAAILLLIVALAGPTFALPVSYVDQGSPSQTASITVQEHNGSVYSGGVYTGPYRLQVNDPQLSPYWMCFDASVSVLVGSPWDAQVVGTPTAAKYIGDDKANMIAYLASQWDGSAPSAKNRDINLAMWEIMADYDTSKSNDGLVLNDGLFSTTTDVLGVQAYLDAAVKALADLGSDEYYQAAFLLPLADGKLSTISQPFVQPVPEPATLLLLGSGLIGLGAWRRRNRGSAA
jgi:hypothetical protein